MKIHSVSKLLAESPFKDKTKEIEQAFSAAGVKTLDDVDNAPRLLGSNVAGYSTYQVCAFLRKAAIEHEIQKSAPKPVPKQKAQVPKVIEEVPEVKEPPAEVVETEKPEAPADKEPDKE
jgi:hypothetical protein